MRRTVKRLSDFINNMQPTQIMVIGFAIVILIGAILLNMPVSTKNGESIGFLNALFTSTSAVCVTGLVAVDTATYWSFFGQLIIITLIQIGGGESIGFLNALFTSTSAVCVTGLVAVDTATYWSFFGQLIIITLIQIGGLGFMTVTTLFALIIKKRINLRERLLIQESLNQIDLSGLVKLTRYILVATFSIEGIGALLLSTVFIPQFGIAQGIWYSVFHAISAFCNAGFDLMGGISGQFSSLTYYVNNFTIVITISMLIILGGIGFPVILDVIRNKKISKLNLHSRVVLFSTAILIVFGMIFIFLAVYNNPETLGSLGFGGKLLAALFQSITARTAGFNTIDLALMRDSSIFVMIILMFIGASPASTGGGVKTTTIATLILTVKSFILQKPASTGGGVKTTTIATLILTVKSFILQKQDIEVCERRISESTIKKSLGIFLIAIVVVVGGTLIISVTDPKFTLPEVGFEVVSAFATVGLSIGGSPNLSILGKIFIMLFMFMGRVGSLTILPEVGFEVVSAFATVGLSIGGSPNLSILGKIFIMLFMFMGRVGSLTIFMALASKGVKKNPPIRYPEGKIIVG